MIPSINPPALRMPVFYQQQVPRNGCGVAQMVANFIPHSSQLQAVESYQKAVF